MRKRRSTVLVTPGKDVTLYIPTDTPPEVIDYMNRLKAEGMFSQGVMDILTRHIVREQPVTAPAEHNAPLDDANHYMDDPVYITEPMEEPEPRAVREPEPEPEPEFEEEQDKNPVIHESFNLDQIFLQAARNAGKLTR